MPYVLGKVKRTVVGDPVADVADIEDALSEEVIDEKINTVEIDAGQVTSGLFEIGRMAWTGTQTEYDALAEKDENTLYLITN